MDPRGRRASPRELLNAYLSGGGGGGATGQAGAGQGDDAVQAALAALDSDGSLLSGMFRGFLRDCGIAPAQQAQHDHQQGDPTQQPDQPQHPHLPQHGKRARSAERRPGAAAPGAGSSSAGAGRPCPAAAAAAAAAAVAGAGPQPLRVSLEELFSGALKPVAVQRHGRALQASVYVEPGVADGARITLPGLGGTGGADAEFVVVQQRHATFRRLRDDLYAIVDVPLLTALTGGPVALRTLGGCELALPVGGRVIQPGAELVVAGEGMPVWGDAAGRRGALHVRFNVAFPSALSTAQQALLRQALGGGDGGETAAPAAAGREDGASRGSPQRERGDAAGGAASGGSSGTAGPRALAACTRSTGSSLRHGGGKQQQEMPRRRRLLGALPALLLALICAAAGPGAAVTAGAAERVVRAGGGSGASLLAALQDPRVTRIVVDGDYDIGATGEFDKYVGHGLPVERNVTVTGAEGLGTVLDLAFVRSAVELCGTCHWVFDNITVANERRGTGGTVDFFLGQPGSTVLMNNVFRLRPACTTAAQSGAVVNQTKRSAYWPNPDGPQNLTYVNASFRGTDFPDSLYLNDYSTDDPRRIQEGRGPMGGYGVRNTNTTRLCRAHVDDACLLRKSSDACVNDLVDAVLAADAQGGGSGGGAGRGGVAAIAAGVAVGVAAVLAAAALGVLWARRRRRRRAREAAIAAALKLGSHSNAPDVEGAPGAKGWTLVSSLTTPLISAGPCEPIEFGELLGAGSYGRVYKARWAGLDVAVKVIEHDAAASEAVETEASLMLSINHPNVLRALHCQTLVKNNVNASSTTGSHAPVASGSLASGHGGKAGGLHRAPSDAGAGAAGGAGSDSRRGSVPAPRGAGAPDSAGGSSGGAPAGSAGWPATNRSLGAPLVCSGRTERRAMHLVLEYADLGTLGAIVSAQAEGAEGAEGSEAHVLQLLLLLTDVACGLSELHRRKIVHGDLNARNVLVASSATAPLGMVAKVADLGLSKAIQQQRTHRTTDTTGTLSHMPPELLRYGRMSTAADVYAFGVMMWEIYTGQAAFRKLHYGQYFEVVVLRNLRPLIPPGMPPDYQLLMEHCWATESANRPSIDRVLECLRFMVLERQGHAAGAPAGGGGAACGAGGAPPALLARPAEARLPRPQSVPPGAAAGSADSGRGGAAAPVGSCGPLCGADEAGSEDGGAGGYLDGSLTLSGSLAADGDGGGPDQAAAAAPRRKSGEVGASGGGAAGAPVPPLAPAGPAVDPDDAVGGHWFVPARPARPRGGGAAAATCACAAPPAAAAPGAGPACSAAPMEPGDAGASPFARLPAEVLPRVLAELDLRERLGAAALVCRAWADAAAAASSEVDIGFYKVASAARRAAALSDWLAGRGRSVRSLSADGSLFLQEPLQLALPLSELQGLRSLVCTSMDMVARGGIDAALPALTRLKISDCALPAALLCPGLRELELSCVHVDAIVDLLHQAPALTMLDLTGVEIGSAALAAAAAVTRLRHLSLEHFCDDDDTTSVAIPPLAPTLTHLELGWLGGGAAGPAALAHLTGLESLALRDVTLVDPAAAFAPLTRLTALELRLWEGGDRAAMSALLRTLPRLARLQDLTFLFPHQHQIFAGCDESASSIASLTQLSRLALRGCGLGPGTAARLFACALPSLRELQIACGECVPAVWLAQAELDALLGACPGLHKLRLSRAVEPGMSCARLGLLSELTSLDLSGDCVSDDDVAHLARALTALQALNLSFLRRLGAAGVASLVDATRLTSLALQRWGFSQGADDGYGMPGVIRLYSVSGGRSQAAVRQPSGLLRTVDCPRAHALMRARRSRASPQRGPLTVARRLEELCHTDAELSRALLAHRNAQLAAARDAQQQTLAAKDQELAAKDKALAAKDQELAAARAREQQLAAELAAVGAREQRLAAELAAARARAAELEQQLSAGCGRG
ncbi:roco8 [Scenedesmus sp. PABB004]|nr:roco8 [Scenedesmus sp. PABB004]